MGCPSPKSERWRSTCFAKLSPRTFCTFRRELSSLRLTVSVVLGQYVEYVEYCELMPERKNFRREVEPRADRGSKRGQHGEEQRSHPARERYQSLARNRNGINAYRIFSRDSPTTPPSRSRETRFHESVITGRLAW